MKVFQDEGLRFPSRLRSASRWSFVHSQRRLRREPCTIRDIRRVRKRTATVPPDDRGKETFSGSASSVTGSRASRMLIPDTSGGSVIKKISGCSSQRSRVRMARASPPREGAALLQGRAVCGCSGKHFRVRYATHEAGRKLGTSVIVDGLAWRTELPVARRGSNRRGCRITGGRKDDASGCRVGPRDRTRDRGPHEEADQLEAGRPRTPRSKRTLHNADSCWSIRQPLVADTLEREWNEKLLHWLRGEMTENGRGAGPYRHRRGDPPEVMAMTTDFSKLWADPATPNRERKRLLAYVVEDATLIKIPVEGITKIHVRFHGGRTETLTTRNPESSGNRLRRGPRSCSRRQAAGRSLLRRDRRYPQRRGLVPGIRARPGRGSARFSAKRVPYLVHTYGLRSRYDRLGARDVHQEGNRIASVSMRRPSIVGRTWPHQGACV